MKWRFLKADHFHTRGMKRVLLHKCANERILLVYKGNKMARVRQNQIHEMLRLSEGGHLLGIRRGTLLKRTEIPDLVYTGEELLLLKRAPFGEKGLDFGQRIIQTRHGSIGHINDDVISREEPGAQIIIEPLMKRGENQ